MNWMPDGRPLPEDLLEMIQKAGARVHLRLVDKSGSYPRTACPQGSSLGQWWTGAPREVNCPECLELVHS